jgi:hypothetical protein
MTVVAAKHGVTMLPKLSAVAEAFSLRAESEFA